MTRWLTLSATTGFVVLILGFETFTGRIKLFQPKVQA